jgi:hypothetical protein
VRGYRDNTMDRRRPPWAAPSAVDRWLAEMIGSLEMFFQAVRQPGRAHLGIRGRR